MSKRELEKAYYKRLRKETKQFDMDAKQRIKTFDEEVKERLTKNHILYSDEDVRGKDVANANNLIDENDGWE